MNDPPTSHPSWKDHNIYCTATSLYFKCYSAENDRAEKSADAAFSVNRAVGLWSFDCVERLTCIDIELTAQPAMASWNPSMTQLGGSKCKGIMFTGQFTAMPPQCCHCGIA